MYKIELRRPKLEDLEALHEFFKIVVSDTFAKEGLADLQDDMEKEIEAKKNYLNIDLKSHGEKRYFLLAIAQDQVIGTIEYDPASQLIQDCANGAYKELVEVGTVFVRPDNQGKGIGNLLLNAMYLTLLSKGMEEFCLDSGYTVAQRIWIKKYGEPDFLLKDYWGKGYDHMIWRRRIQELPIIFRIGE